MRGSRSWLGLALATTLGSGCAGADLVGTEEVQPAAPSGSFHGPGAWVADVSGQWSWSNVESVSFPPFIALALGIQPEGPHLTHARCESAGTLELAQVGVTFEGVAQKTFNACVTNGGQIFQQPGFFFTITDGRIAGAAVKFSINSPTVTPCPHHAVITEAENGTATALRGTGRCIIPGHPRSESTLELDPPPGGGSKTLRWEAVRP